MKQNHTCSNCGWKVSYNTTDDLNLAVKEHVEVCPDAECDSCGYKTNNLTVFDFVAYLYGGSPIGAITLLCDICAQTPIGKIQFISSYSDETKQLAKSMALIGNMFLDALKPE